MEEKLVSVANEFSGLDMAALIGGPLKAACDAQVILARATLDFIEEVGLEPANEKGERKVRTANFSFDRASEGTGEQTGSERVEMNVPLLAIVNIPALSIDTLDIVFDMEVKSSVSSESSSDKNGELEGSAGLKIGPFSMNVKIKGSIACHEKNTRSSDNSAKYHVELHASQQKTPEGLLRMLDILSGAVVPASVTKNEQKAA